MYTHIMEAGMMSQYMITIYIYVFLMDLGICQYTELSEWGAHVRIH
jgi:hypothetical protein